MANINLPDQRQNIWLSNDATVVSDGTVDLSWYHFYFLMRQWIIENSQNGTTAQRPTTNLYIGRVFRDNTLGYHVHVDSINPVVWHNEAGAVV